MTHDAKQEQHDRSTHRAWRYGYVDAAELVPRAPGKSRRARARHAGDAARTRSRRDSALGRRGVALVVVITAIAIMAVFVADLIESTTTDFHVATAERDRLKAEYLAKSGLNLTRLLIGHEKEIRAIITPFYTLLLRRPPPPQINVWDFADTLLRPFADIKGAKEEGAEGAGLDFGAMQGVKDTGGTFEVVTVPENAKINLNVPLFFDGDNTRKSTAEQLFNLTGGRQSPQSPYDPMFSARDSDGHFTTRLDICSDVIDWWDYDDQRTTIDPGSGQVTTAGSEDNIYSQLPEPYPIKNAPFDSLEELRMIRGIGDDFWATFVDPKPDDPRARNVTIYGSGAVNVNLAQPEVLLARLCSSLADQPLCRDPMQIAAFVSLFRTARSFIPVALFSTVDDFLNFVQGKENAGLNMYAALMGFLGKDSPYMMWVPFVIPPDLANKMKAMFLVEASIFTIQSIGKVGRTQVKISTVINNDRMWIPPKGVSGTMPVLGVAQHYRVE